MEKTREKLVTITQEELRRLRHQSQAYRKLATDFHMAALIDSVTETVDDFRETGLYTKEFLENLERGLRKSSYAKRYDHKTASNRS